jgi:hypothetical protein
MAAYALTCTVRAGPVSPGSTWSVTFRLAAVIVPAGILLAMSVTTVTPGWAIAGEGVAAKVIATGDA